MAQANDPDISVAKSAEVFFSIGSNYGDKKGNVIKGLEWLSKLLSDFKCSSVYETPDCHGGNKIYFNAVAYGRSALEPQDLEGLCKRFEVDCGRDATMRNMGNVPLDIDLVIYNGKILRPNDFKREFFKIGYEMI